MFLKNEQKNGGSLANKEKVCYSKKAKKKQNEMEEV